MPEPPDFLPEMLNLKGDWNDDILPLLYSVFERDIKHSIPICNRRKIFHDNRILPGGDKEEGFWHLITGKDEKTKIRLPDYNRSKRLPWLRAIIDNCDSQEITSFKYEKGKRKTRLYLWLKKLDYIVILEKRKNYYMLITAYYIDEEHEKRRFEKWYRNRL